MTLGPQRDAPWGPPQGTNDADRVRRELVRRIRAEFEAGSVLDEKNWDDIQTNMIDTMIRFEGALRPELDKLP